MNLEVTPDDWLQDIFVHLDFAVQKRLYRCCRKWSRLLVTKCVVRTVTVDTRAYWLDDDRFSELWDSAKDAISAIIADVHIVIFSGLTTEKDRSTEDSYNHGQYFLVSPFLDAMHLANRASQYHLVLANPTGTNILAVALSPYQLGRAYGSLQLRHVTFPFRHVWLYLRGMACSRGAPILHNDLHLWLGARYYLDSEGSFGDICVGKDDTIYTNEESFYRFVLDHIPPPCQNQIDGLRARLLTTDLVRLQRRMRLILVETQPDIPLHLQEVLVPPDCSRFNTLNLWLLFAWTHEVFDTVHQYSMDYFL